MNLNTFTSICALVFGTNIYHLNVSNVECPKAVGFLKAPFETENMVVMATFSQEEQKIDLTFYNAVYGWNMDDSVYGVILERVSTLIPNIGFDFLDCRCVALDDDYRLTIYPDTTDEDEGETDEEEGHVQPPKGKPP